MGVVYEAYDREREMPVALKTLRSVEPDLLIRLKREFRSLTTIEHENVVALYDLVAAGHDLFFTMELIDGVDFLSFVGRGRPSQPSDQSLTTRTVMPELAEGTRPVTLASPDDTAATALSTGPITGKAAPPSASTPIRRPFDDAVDPERLYDTLDQLVTAINALHARNLIHCDLKPSNVMVTRNGRVVVLDFGIASSEVQRESGAAFTGTAAYCAPEQCQGQIGPAGDWYSVGVMLYEALAGARPFDGSLDQVIAAKLARRPRSIRDYVVDGPDALLELCDALLSPDPGDRPNGREIGGEIGRILGRRTTPAHPQTRDVFVGRKAELEALSRAFRAARRRPGAAVIAGPSGMGKSALARKFLTSLEGTDSLILQGRCHEREQVPFNAFDPIVDGLAEHLAALGDAGHTLVPDDFSLLARLFPVLAPYAPASDARDRALSADQTRVRAVAALRDALARLAKTRPVAIAIDDLQWADQDSLALLVELTEQPGAPPVFWLITARDEHLDGASPTAEALQAMSSRIEVVRLALPALATDDRRELARRLQPDGALATDAARWLDDTDGNPMLIAELVRFSRDNPEILAGGGNRSIDEILRLRVGALSSEDRAFVELTAVASEPTAARVLTRALEMDSEAAARCLRRLDIGGFVRTAESGLEPRLVCYHDRVRESILAALAPDAARDYHRALASSLGQQSDARPDRIARHWLAAGEPRRAHAHIVRAAERAVSQLAFERAASLYRQALDTPHLAVAGRVELLAALASCNVNLGQIQEAAAVYAEAAELVDGERRLDFRRLAAEQLLTGGYLKEGLEAASDVLAEVGLTMPSSSAAAIPGLLWHRLRMVFRPPRLADPPPANRSAVLAATRADICWSMGNGLSMVDSYRGLLFYFRTLERSLDLGDPLRSARSCGITAGVFSAMGSMGPAEALLAVADRAVEIDPSPLVRVYQLLGVALLAYTPRNQWRTLMSSCEKAQQLWEEAGRVQGWEIDCMEQFRAWSQMYLGELPEMDRRVRRQVRAAQMTGNRFLEIGLRARMVLVHLMRDQADTALADSEDAVAARLPDSKAFQMQHYYGFVGQCESLAYAGRATLTPALEGSWGAMRKFPLVMARVEGVHARARLALLEAREASGGARRKLLKRVHRWARDIGRHALPLATSFALLLRAGVAHLRGDADAERRELERAIAELDALDTHLYAAAARRRLGQVLGGDEGAALVAASEQWMAAQRVTSPRRMARMLVPPWE